MSFPKNRFSMFFWPCGQTSKQAIRQFMFTGLFSTRKRIMYTKMSHRTNTLTWFHTDKYNRGLSFNSQTHPGVLRLLMIYSCIVVYELLNEPIQGSTIDNVYENVLHEPRSFYLILSNVRTALIFHPPLAALRLKIIYSSINTHTLRYVWFCNVVK